MQSNKYFLAPLMGAAISIFIFIIYLISSFYNKNSILDIIYALFSVMPIMFITFILISYVICAIVGFPVLFIKNKYLLSNNVFWLLSFLIFSFLGLLSAVISYQIEKNIGKSIAIFLSLSFGGLFSSSLFSVLNGDVKGK